MEAHKPNIVFIMADDMGWGDVGCNNPGSQIPTPHIDRLAAEGTRFTDAHSSCGLCTPTRYGLMTGRYYWRTPKKHALVMPYDPPTIEPDRPTLASMLKERGYATACIGKWHLGLLYPTRDGASERYTTNEKEVDFTKDLDGGPTELGFDLFYGTAGCSTSDSPYCYIENKRTDGIPTVPSTEDLHKLPGFYPGLMEPNWDIEEVDRILTEKAVGYIHDRAANHSGEPFFLYLPLSAPHIPWERPAFARNTSGDGPRGDMNVLVDWCVGEVRAALEAKGILDGTLLVFTSDNGPQYNSGETGHRACGPFRGCKNSAFEGGHREPFVARWPGHVPAGAVRDDLLCLTDMMATLAELTGAPMPEGGGEDSFSVLPALLGAGACEPRPAMVNDTGGLYSKVGDFAIRRDAWKLIVTVPKGEKLTATLPKDESEQEERFLFNLEDDPSETTNLLDEHPLVARDLEALLNRIKNQGSRSLAP